MADRRTQHQRVRDHVLDGITAGTYQPGERLPRYLDIANTVGVSYDTARRAVGQLITQGWLYARPGVGIYVAEQLPDRPASDDVQTVLADHERRLRDLERRRRPRQA